MVLFFYNYTRIPTSKLIPCVSLEGLIHPFRSQYTYVFLPAGGMYRRGRLMTAAAWGWHGGRHQLCYRWQARVIDPLLKRCARWASRPTPAPSYPSNCFVFSFFFSSKWKLSIEKMSSPCWVSSSTRLHHKLRACVPLWGQKKTQWRV